MSELDDVNVTDVNVTDENVTMTDEKNTTLGKRNIEETPVGLYPVKMKSIKTSTSRPVPSLTRQIHTHGFVVVNDTCDSGSITKEYYTVPEGKRAIIFTTVIPGLTSINEPSVVKMISDSFENFSRIYYTEDPDQIPEVIQTYQYNTVLKLAELIVPEIIYLIPYHYGIFAFYKDILEKNIELEPTIELSKIQRDDYDEAFKMLSDLLKYSEELLTNPQNFLTCAVYNQDDQIIQKKYQTDSTLLKNAENPGDWNGVDLQGQPVSSSSLKSVANPNTNSNVSYLYNSKNNPSPNFGTITKKGKKTTYESTTGELLNHAFENNSLVLILDNSCYEIINTEGQLVTNTESIEMIMNEVISQPNRLTMTDSAKNDIIEKVNKIKGISRNIGAISDTSLTEKTLPDQLLILRNDKFFMTKFRQQQIAKNKPPEIKRFNKIAAAKKASSKKGGKQKTLKRSIKKIRNKAKKSRKRRYRCTKKRVRFL